MKYDNEPSHGFKSQMKVQDFLFMRKVLAQGRVSFICIALTCTADHRNNSIERCLKEASNRVLGLQIRNHFHKKKYIGLSRIKRMSSDRQTCRPSTREKLECLEGK